MKLKTKLFVKAAVVSFATIASLNIAAQQSNPKLGKAEIVSYSRNTGLPNFIKFNAEQNISDDGFAAWISDALNLPGNAVFKAYNVEKDKSGFTHTRYKEYVNNFPVEGSMLIAHSKESRLTSVNGDYFSDFNNSTTAAITEESALKNALKKVNAVKYKWENKAEEEAMKARLKQPDFTYFPKGELVIVHKKNADYTASNMRLAYKFNIYAEKPLYRSYVFVDANSGEVIAEEQIIHTADAVGTAHTKYSGVVTMTSDNYGTNQYRLRETGRGNGIETYNLADSTTYINTDFTNNSSIWNITGIDQAASDAHWGAEMTYDYYMQVHNRNSIDNAGLALLSYVHYGVGFDNAFWDGTEMTYGDGDGTQFSIFTALDVCGHEITHGLTSHTAALSGGEADALNEGFSDIFGTTIEWFARPNQHDWIMGSDFTMNGAGFRDMSNPKNLGQPNCYLGANWDPLGEPHNNNGPLIYWYYLLCQGGSGTNDLGNAFHVNGITMNEARMIAFRGLTTYLTPSATYADARTATIQSAVDLYGACSPEAIAATNAWYAVGVGNLFTDNVIAGFNEQQSSFCSAPALVNFSNTSLNGTSYYWDFGDGGHSSLASPSHTYTGQGIYTVKLHVTGTSLCSTSDSIIVSNCITVANIPSPIAASCIPGTKAYCCSIGISNVTMNTINYSSGNASEGYKNFTCADSTQLTAGDWCNLNVTTNYLSKETVKAWIDYNNDGLFNNTTELVMSSDSALANHTAIVYTPLNAVLNTPLRMRVMSDAAAYPINTACDSLQNGQAEDYTVYFKANALPPVCNFSADVLTVPTGSIVHFNDLTLHAPTGWHWSFTGGSPTASTLQNPSIAYNSIGIYPVKLVASNSFGGDSLTKTAYINVVNIFKICADHSTNVNSGIIYDSGGPAANYTDMESCGFLIHPPCAASITLGIDSIDTEPNYDSVFVYDGADALSPLLFSFSGNMSNTSVTAASGQMYIHFHSDEFVNYSGFKFHWNVLAQTHNPVSAFSSSPAAPAAATPVQFSDQTTNNPTAWLWKFGDLGTSFLQNPSHTYSQPGNYTVKLISWNCLTSDSTTSVITVMPTGIEEMQNVNGWKIYPNPANGNFTMELELAKDERAEMKIVNSLGQLIIIENHNFVSGNNKLLFNLSGSAKGVYFAELRTLSSVLRQRIIIN